MFSFKYRWLDQKKKKNSTHYSVLLIQFYLSESKIKVLNLHNIVLMVILYPLPQFTISYVITSRPLPLFHNAILINVYFFFHFAWINIYMVIHLIFGYFTDSREVNKIHLLYEFSLYQITLNRNSSFYI